MAKKKRTYEDDDGRVIASMNVAGMRWYQKSPRQTANNMHSSSDYEDLAKEETREIIKGALKASLLIVGIFILAMLLFILFCIFVWFR